MRFAASFSLILLLLLNLTMPAFGEDDKDAGNLPANVEEALSSLFSDIPQGRSVPSAETLSAVLDFVTTDGLSSAKVRPARRPQGQGAFLRERINVPLKKIIAYTMNPSVPGETVYPAVVRRNAWLPGSEILVKGKSLLETPLPPSGILTVRGKEFEETTPDASSGCYYIYHLNRLFVLAPYKGRAALFSVSSMPNRSEVGKKGATVGKDADWTHVYSGETGTNLPLLGWAETNLYGSVSVSVFLEDGSGTDLYMFKWVRGGWAGANVIKPAHIIAGMQRFADSMRQVLENPNTPAPEAIAAEFSALSALSDAELRARLSGYAQYLSKQPDKLLKETAFAKVLAGGAYADTLSRDDLIAELLKLYMRGQLGTLPAEAASTLH